MREEEESNPTLCVQNRGAKDGAPTWETKATLPDAAGRFANHRRVRLAAECVGKIGHVRNHAVDTILAFGVFVGQGLQACLLRSLVFAPDLSVADVEALFGRV